jgi:hypothetical protein
MLCSLLVVWGFGAGPFCGRMIEELEPKGQDRMVINKTPDGENRNVLGAVQWPCRWCKVEGFMF